MRELVGPTDPAAFDNPTGAPLFPDLPEAAYDAVFDFGCGCGRVARQLLQQSPQPRRYHGVDLHAGMVRWCRKHLAPAAAGFRFDHHDVFNRSFNPEANDRCRSLPAADASASLAIAWSVFTHLDQAQAEFYLLELARILRPDGVLRTTFFLFDKGDFPMMQAFQNALFINEVDPSNAVIFDRAWLRQTATAAGLRMVKIRAPEIRGYHWQIDFERTRSGAEHVEYPPDVAPRQAMPPPVGPPNAHEIG